MTRYLQAVDLQTGHVRTVARQHVDADLVQRLTGAVQGVQEGREVPWPGVEPWSLSGAVRGPCATFTIREEDEVVGVVGVALRSRCGAALWRSLLEGEAPDPPGVPWVAVRGSVDPVQTDALAWAFLEASR